jgi:STAS-like domain of unknown function (DUF4325)
MSATIKLPRHLRFNDQGSISFEPILTCLDWSLESQGVEIDLSTCEDAINFQALSLIIPYCWELRANGCYVEFLHSENSHKMWNTMGASGWSQVLSVPHENFRSSYSKPLTAIRNPTDFKLALSKSESYAKNFDIEYEKTLRYVLSEILYNTMEHGKAYRASTGDQHARIPSVMQFNWYRKSNSIKFIVADLGIGVKRHLEQAYPGCDSDADALLKAIQPQVSGTFGHSGNYTGKDNAGMGLYKSSNIVQRLRAQMYIVSGEGLLHISPKDITTKRLDSGWPGTFVYGEIDLGRDRTFELHALMSELREKARQEINAKNTAIEEKFFYIHIRNYFGHYAEDKDAAKRFRDKEIIPKINEGLKLRIDFVDVKAAPHSFLSALLATPITMYGIRAYKNIKVINAPPEIRETIDYILEENA